MTSRSRGIVYWQLYSKSTEHRHQHPKLMKLALCSFRENSEEDER